MTKRDRTCLWFDANAEEAASFYVSLIPDSYILSVFRPQESGPVRVVEFELGGTPLMGLNGSPQFVLTEAASVAVTTGDQHVTDRLSATLISNGGCESRCGWLRDRFGLSRQIVPEALPRLLFDPGRVAAGRTMQAMLTMCKIDIAGLDAAFRGD
jgi:predicted 3-demethylubiquinone-9 3-methyltransferase (glyoxalase superfamily)